MKLVNLTPHDLTIHVDGQPVFTLPSKGLARAEEHDTPAGSVEVDGHDVPVVVKTYSQISGLPAPQEGTAYIVSTIVADLEPGRPDVFFPGSMVRDAAGRIAGCHGLSRVPSQAGR
jgi:hypothetical protein